MESRKVDDVEKEISQNLVLLHGGDFDPAPPLK